MPDIYNPWSVTNYLDQRILAPYWANSSANRLVNDLIRLGDEEVKRDFQTLLEGGSLHRKLDKQVVFGELEDDPDAIWSLLAQADHDIEAGHVSDAQAGLSQAWQIYGL